MNFETMHTEKSEFKWCTFATVNQRTQDPFKLSKPSALDLAQVEEEAAALAQRAYVRGEPQARHLAERLLYLIHSITAFSPPVDPIVGRIWLSLAKPKLDYDLQARNPPSSIDADYMVREFQAAVQRADE